MTLCHLAKTEGLQWIILQRRAVRKNGGTARLQTIACSADSLRRWGN